MNTVIYKAVWDIRMLALANIKNPSTQQTQNLFMLERLVRLDQILQNAHLGSSESTKDLIQITGKIISQMTIKDHPHFNQTIYSIWSNALSEHVSMS